MGIEVKTLRSDNETYICNTENVISLNPVEEKRKEKLIILITCQTPDIDVMLFCEGFVGN